MRFAPVTLIAALVAAADLHAQVQPASRIRRVVVAVAATNDEWTTTGLSVNKEDLLIISAEGLIKVGAMTGEVDATGTRPNANSSTGYGILEFKIGVSAGQPAGVFALHTAETRGELKFRVKDTRYDDNSGAFDVDVVVIPQAALPPPTRVGDLPEVTEDVARSLITAMKSDLRNMVSAQESHFSDKSTYAAKLADIGFRLSDGVALKSLTVGAGGWKAIVTHARMPGVECGIAVGGDAKNPVVGNAGEGEPACR